MSITTGIDERAALRVQVSQIYDMQGVSLFEAPAEPDQTYLEECTQVSSEMIADKVLSDLNLGPERPYYTFHDVQRVGKLAAKLALQSTIESSTAAEQGE